ncbi:MAG TPA: YqzM family protein [Bacilli bacterium]
MSEQNNPELHINEEPRNDFADVATGFAGMFIFIIVVTIIVTIISTYR